MCSESIQCEHALDPASLRTYSSVLAIKTKLYVCIFLAAAFVLNHAEHDPTLQSVHYVCKRHWQSVVRETCQWCTITKETTLLAHKRLYLVPLLTDNTAQLGIVPTNLLSCCIQNRCQTNLEGALNGSAMIPML